MSGPEHNHLLAQQQTIRHLGIERSKKMKPDKKQDKKFFVIAIASIVLTCAVLATVPYWGEVLLWLLD